MFDPRAVGPMKIIVDLNNPEYYEARAIEFIQEAKDSARVFDALKDKKPGDLIDGAVRIELEIDSYHDCLKKAIGLLTLARLARGYTPDAAKKK